MHALSTLYSDVSGSASICSSWLVYAITDDMMEVSWSSLLKLFAILFEVQIIVFYMGRFGYGRNSYSMTQISEFEILITSVIVASCSARRRMSGWYPEISINQVPSAYLSLLYSLKTSLHMSSWQVHTDSICDLSKS